MAPKEVPVPRSVAQAAALEARIGLRLAIMRRRNAKLARTIEKLKAEAEEKNEKDRSMLRELALALYTYASHNWGLLAGPVRKSVQLLTAGVLKWSAPRTSVVIEGSEEDAVAYAEENGMPQFVRTTIIKELNRQAMHEDPELAKTIPGVSMRAEERFVIAPALSPEHLEHVRGRWHLVAKRMRELL